MLTRLGTALVLVGAIATAAFAESAADPGIPEKARRSRKVVVATVLDVQSTFDVNEYGDRLIVSHALLQVDETIAGTHASVATLAVEGGTVGDLTLEVSDMPAMKKGQRAVVFLADAKGRPWHVPAGRGHGVMTLDRDNRVAGTTMTLAEIRKAVRTARREKE